MNDVTVLVAYVRPARRAAVAHALRQVGLAGWTESEVMGRGSAVGGHGVPHAKFEVIVATNTSTLARRPSSLPRTRART